MSVATDLQQIAENVPQVYAAGKRDQKAAFWETFQDGGNRTNYQYGFAGSGFSEKIFPPKYTPLTFASSTAGRFLFYYNSAIKRVNFPLVFRVSGTSNVFAYATALETIDNITVTDLVTYINWFQGCESLVNVTFDGTIGNSIDLSPCVVLSVASAKSVLSHLSTSGSGKTVTFASTIQSAVEADAEAAALISTAQANGWTVLFS